MTETPTPRRIEWAGPEGWTVWADEDGCHLRAPAGHALEQPDVERLFSLWQHARAVTEEGHIPAPKPMSREEARQANSLVREEWHKRRALRAIENEFNDTDIAPF